MYGSKFRTRSIENVLEELDLLIHRFDVGRIFFHDQLFLFKRKRIQTLLEAIIEKRYNITWRCQTRLFSLDQEILELMKRSGCTEVHVGLETTSPSVQKAMRKSDADIETFKDIYEIGRKIGISISPNMMIGLPNDTLETVLESARFYNSMGFPFLTDVAIPYPDTLLYEIGVNEGKIKGQDWDSITQAAGFSGNSLTYKELDHIIKEVHKGNLRLRRSQLTWKQKVLKVPGYLFRKMVGLAFKN
jgi:radical SAM superfamily enzyme YgiQ (UPF0313 family)